MKYIKTYEELNTWPQIGDYIISDKQYHEIDDFLTTHIGKIVHIEEDDDYPYYVAQYSDVPTDFFDFFNHLQDYPSSRVFKRDEIIEYSKNKEDLKPYILINKYNL
jgi:hypothetical protein